MLCQELVTQQEGDILPFYAHSYWQDLSKWKVTLSPNFLFWRQSHPIVCMFSQW